MEEPRCRLVAFDGDDAEAGWSGPRAEDDAGRVHDAAAPAIAWYRFGEFAFRAGVLISHGTNAVVSEAEMLPRPGPCEIDVASMVMRVYTDTDRAGRYLRGWSTAYRELPPDPRIMRPLAISDDGRAVLLHRYPSDLFDVLHSVRELPPKGGAEDPRPLFRPLRAAIDVAEAVLFMHAHGLAHRDVKPENVMVTAAGGIVLGDLDFVVCERFLPLSRFSGTSAYLPAPLRLAVDAARAQGTQGAQARAPIYDAFEADAFATAATVLDILTRCSHEDPEACASGVRQLGVALGKPVEDAMRVALHAPCDEALARLAQRLRLVL